MRVLLTAAPEVGHIVPLFGVGRALREAGHEVCLATHPSRHDLVTAAGMAAVAAGMSSEQRNAERRRRWPRSDLEPGTWAVRTFTEILAPSALAELRAVMDDWRPDLVVHEEGEYAGPVAAALVGIPWVTHGWGSPLRPEDELRSLEEDAAALWAGAGVEMPPRAGLYEYGLIDPCPAILDPARASPVTRWPVRPSMLHDEEGGGSEHDGDRSTCYVGFGTVPDFANATRDITAAAEGALSAGLRVVVTASDASLVHALQAGAAGRVEVREFVSFPDLLPSCRLVVSHGGAGTTLAALAHGVPLVVVPRGLPSQERMAAAVTHANVGRVARADGANRAAIVEAVRAAADDTAMLQRAEAAQRAIACMPAPEAVIPQLEALVQ